VSTPIFEPEDLVESGSWQVVVRPAAMAYQKPPVPTPGFPKPRGSGTTSAPTPRPAVGGQYYTTGVPVNVTTFRDAPTQIGNLSTSDPFGPNVGTLTFPAITPLDSLGVGDLEWCVAESDVDISWVAPDGTILWTWEGYLVMPQWGMTEKGVGLTWTLTGAMHQMDNYLAKPEYLYQPLPYEVAILRQFPGHPDSHLSSPDGTAIGWPDGWTKTFRRRSYPAAQPWLLPQGVYDGQLWSGMLTRETGHFEPVLTNYIQGLLANMYTDTGQFTLVLDRGRTPRLTHRTRLTAPKDGETVYVDLAWNGVVIVPESDYQQKIGVIYGQGRAANGDTYSGMEVTADGSETYYDPLAYDPQVHPTTDNPRLNPAVMRKEVSLQYPDGLDAAEARKAAGLHRNQFADPGYTASLTLKIDPRRVGTDARVDRATVTAGSSIQVRGLFGRPEGVLFHVTESSIEHDLTVTLTLDTQFRDYLTVDQVRRKTRDALIPYRMLSTAGTFDPKIPDLLFPWSYHRGSGVIPWGAAPLFASLGPAAVRAAGGVSDPEAIPFPWTDYTKAFPPKKYPKFYVHVPPKNKDADYNWANSVWKKGRVYGKRMGFIPYPVLFAAAGSVRMIQIAAYDRDGNVKAVPFHVSLYGIGGRPSYTTMPTIPKGAPTQLVTKTAVVHLTKGSKTVSITHLPRGHGIAKGMAIHLSCAGIRGMTRNWSVASVGPSSITVKLSANASASVSKGGSVYKPTPQPYPAAQHYPFFPGAWEKINPDGTTPRDGGFSLVSSGTTMLYGAGTYYEKAGYYPGSSSDPTNSPTGLHVDETPFPFDFRNNSLGGVSIYDTPATNSKTPSRVRGWVMIYCDADAAADTYFLGRCFRQDYLQA